MTTDTTPAFAFPPIHAFPPFYTLQPNTTTLHAQLTSWSALILAYCRHHRLFKLALSDALNWDLFHSSALSRRLSLKDAREVIDFMRTEEDGRAEWVGKSDVCWVWWRKPEEWAEMVERWVDDTAQKQTVLTLYELTAGETTRGTGESGWSGDGGDVDG